MPVMTSWSMKTICSLMGPDSGATRPARDERSGGASSRDRPDPGDPARLVQPVDHRLVPLEDHRAPDLLRAGELAVVGVELLVEQRDAADLRRRRQIAVHPPDRL